jgi:flagellar hook-associated protein 2
MTDTSTIFTGSSRYAGDFEAIIERAVAVASLGLSRLGREKASLDAESAAIRSLAAKFAAIEEALAGLETATGVGSYSASVSNGSVLRANVAPGALEASYSVEVTGLGSVATSMSRDGLPVVTNPSTQSLSAASAFTLAAGGQSFAITPAAKTLDALVPAINASGAGVRASIVNLGSAASPDYRLALRGAKLADGAIQLGDGSSDLLDNLSSGAPATYKVNGLVREIESDTRTIALAPGLTVELLGESPPGAAVAVTVSRSATPAANALSSFAQAYNAAVEEIDRHRGEAGGALAGRSILASLAQALRAVAGYTAARGSLHNFGLGFDQAGKLSLDREAFSAASGDSGRLQAFLSDAQEGGFLKWAGDLLRSMGETSGGAMQAAIASSDAQAAEYEALVGREQERVAQVRQALVDRISACDALIASLEQQALYVTNLFESMRLAARSYQ